MKKKTNLNDYIYVKILKRGYQVWMAHNLKYGVDNNESYYKSQADKDGYTPFQIHDFISIFGDSIMFNVCELNVLIDIKEE